jgi:hypothetical protein
LGQSVTLRVLHIAQTRSARCDVVVSPLRVEIDFDLMGITRGVARVLEDTIGSGARRPRRHRFRATPDRPTHRASIAMGVAPPEPSPPDEDVGDRRPLAWQLRLPPIESLRVGRPRDSHGKYLGSAATRRSGPSHHDALECTP